MAQVQTIPGVSIQASDVSGQKILNVPNIPLDATIGEITHGLLAKMNLTESVPYQLRLERQRRHLHASERVADALETGDKVVLHPSIDAGGY
jgi:hypothetical protein